MLAPGDQAPRFTLEADSGEEITLSACLGRPVVLYFYPRDETPACALEACAFRSRWSAVRETGASLFGISPDSVASHRRFRKRYRLPFPLLADPDHRVAEAYGAWGEKQLFGHRYQGVLRSTFIVDPAGCIARVFPKVKVKGHAAEVLAALRNMKV